MFKKIKMSFCSFITSSYMAFIAPIAGVLMGMYQPTIAVNFKPLNDIFINLLQLSAMPIVIFSVIMGVFNIVKHLGSGSADTSIASIVTKCSIWLVTIAAIVLSLMLIFHPWDSILSDKKTLATIYQHDLKLGVNEINFEEKIIEANQKDSFTDFIAKNIPTNIFSSLSKGNLLQITIFCIIFGYCLGKSYLANNEVAKTVKNICEFLYEMFISINKKVLDILPIFLFFMISYQLSNMGTVSSGAILTILTILMATAGFVIALMFIIVWLRSGQSFLYVARSFVTLTIVAILTSSTIAALGKSIEVMIEELKFNKAKAEMMMPVSVSLFQFDSIIYFITGTSLAIALFGPELNILDYALIMLMVIITSVTTIGAFTPIAKYQPMALILATFSMPFESVLFIFIILDPVLDIFGTLANTYGACATTAICTEREKA